MSKSQSSELVREAGTAVSVWQRLEEAVHRHGGRTEDLTLLTQPAGEVIIDAVAKQLALIGTTSGIVYDVAVNYDLPHQQQIAAGQFDWVTSYDGQLIRKDPTKHLVPVPSGQEKQRIMLLHLNSFSDTEKVLAEMEKRHLRPTSSHETLAFAAAYPDMQRKYVLIGLGSVWIGSGGSRGVLSLGDDSGRLALRQSCCNNSSKRNLCLAWCDHPWHTDCRFLVVRKS